MVDLHRKQICSQTMDDVIDNANFLYLYFYSAIRMLNMRKLKLVHKILCVRPDTIFAVSIHLPRLGDGSGMLGLISIYPVDR